jgi:X-linked retinitis pigmentosa GTPase regulator
MQLNENLKPDLVAGFDTSETELSLEVSSSDNVNAVSGLPSGAGVLGSNPEAAIALEEDEEETEEEHTPEETEQGAGEETAQGDEQAAEVDEQAAEVDEQAAEVDEQAAEGEPVQLK